MWKRSRKSQVDEVDEHDQPTEPMPRLVLPSPSTPHSSQDAVRTVLPHPAGRHVPSSSFTRPGASPINVRTEQPGEIAPQRKHQDPAPSEQGERKGELPPLSLRILPVSVGLCVVGLQLSLLMRLAFTLTNWSPNGLWADVVYALSGLLLWPFFTLIPSMNLPAVIRMVFDILLAILVYSFCSRLIVRLLKVYLGVR